MNGEPLLERRKRQLQEVTNYLQNGTYSFTDDHRMMYLEESQNDPLLVKSESSDDALKDTLTINSKEGKLFSGSALWFGINGDLKVFNSKEVLTKAHSQESLTKKLTHYQYFSRYFTVPKITTIDQLVGVTIEERIISTDDLGLTKSQLLKKAMEDYLDYFQRISSKGQLSRENLQELLVASPHRHNQLDFQLLLDKISPDLTKTTFPRLPVHGDLWSENLIVTKEGIVYLDFDESGENWFFYDFFKFLWNELDVHGDEHLLQDYLVGGFDDALSRWFAVFGFTFDPDHRGEYFLLFFMDFLLTVSDSYPYSGKRLELVAFKEKVMDRYHELFSK